jgi:hypothetical protein
MHRRVHRACAGRQASCGRAGPGESSRARAGEDGAVAWGGGSDACGSAAWRCTAHTCRGRRLPGRGGSGRRCAVPPGAPGPRRRRQPWRQLHKWPRRHETLCHPQRTPLSLHPQAAEKYIARLLLAIDCSRQGPWLQGPCQSLGLCQLSTGWQGGRDCKCCVLSERVWLLQLSGRGRQPCSCAGCTVCTPVCSGHPSTHRCVWCVSNRPCGCRAAGRGACPADQARLYLQTTVTPDPPPFFFLNTIVFMMRIRGRRLMHLRTSAPKWAVPVPVVGRRLASWFFRPAGGWGLISRCQGPVKASSLAIVVGFSHEERMPSPFPEQPRLPPRGADRGTERLIR